MVRGTEAALVPGGPWGGEIRGFCCLFYTCIFIINRVYALGDWEIGRLGREQQQEGDAESVRGSEEIRGLFDDDGGGRLVRVVS